MINLVNVPSLNAALNGAVEFCRGKTGRVDVVVPDKLSLFMERFLFEKLNISSSFNLRVSTLNRFAKRGLNVDKSKQISKLGAIILIHKILNDNAQNFNVLKSFNYSFSYAENVYRTIGQLKASKIMPEEMQKFSHKNKQLEGKILDLAKIYTEYERLKTGLVDASDMFLMSTITIAENRENEDIVFVGFDDFTAIEYSIIEQLGKSNNVYVYSYLTRTNNKHIFNGEVGEQLKNIAYKNEIGYKVLEENLPTNSLLEFLQNHLFATDDDTFCQTTETAKVFSANSVASEIEFAARDIRQKVLNGKKYNQFGVAVYGIENKVEKIEEIFNKYEINYYIDCPLSINKSVVYKFVLSVFKFNLENNVLPHVIDIINSPFFNIPQWGKAQLIDKLKKFNFIYDVNSLEIDDENFDKLKKFLSDFSFEKTISIENCRVKLKNSLKFYNFDEILAQICENCGLKAKILLNKSCQIIFDLFDEVIKFYDYANIQTFYDIYTHIASVLSVNNLPATIDAVKVVDADNFVEIFDHLYLINCTQENAPSIKADCGIILDAEIEELNFKNKLSPTIAHINRLSKLRLFNTTLLFNKSLTVSYNKSQSVLIKELLKRIQVDFNGAKINILPEYEETLKGYEALSYWDYVWAAHKFNQQALVGDAIKTDKLSQQSINLISNFNTISASSLESYFKCPLNHFIANQLKIKPDLDNTLQTFDIGNILHHILYVYYNLDKNVGDRRQFVTKTTLEYLKNEERITLNASSPIIKNLIEEAVRMLDGVDNIDKYSLFKTDKKLVEYSFKNFNLGNVNLMGFVDRIDVCEQNNQKYLRIIDYKTRDADAKLKELYYGKKLQLFLYNLAMEHIFNMPGVGSFYLPLHNNYEREEENTYSLDGFFENTVDVVHALDVRLQPQDKSNIVNVTLTNKQIAAQNTNKALSPQKFSSLKQYAKQVSNLAVEEMRSGFIAASPLDYKKACDYCPYMQICLKNSCGVVDRKTVEVDVSSFDLSVKNGGEDGE